MSDHPTRPHPVDVRPKNLSFEVSDEEQAAWDAWFKEHEETCNGYTGAIGGKYTFQFTETGLGVVVKVSCGLCKTVKDLTDYDSW